MEIVLDRLIHRLMTVAVEHAGAARGLLILPGGDGHRIEAEATTDHDAVEVQQGVRWRHGLRGEDVDRCSREPALAERRDQRTLVDDAAAGRVHDPGALLHQPQLAFTDQPLGLCGAGQVDRHDVRLDQERLQARRELDSQRSRPFLRHIRVVRDDPHAERERALGDHGADPAQANDPERLAHELDPLEARPHAWPAPSTP